MPNWPELVAREFKEVDLGDERLEKRCQQLANRFCAQPDKSIPEACGDWGDTKAAYRFFDNDRVTREKLLEPHIEQTVCRMRRQNKILAVQDTTFFNMGRRKREDGFGLIGDGEKSHGFIAHSTIALSGNNFEVLGVIHQEVWVRTERKPKDERTSQVRRRPRESERWVRGIEKVSQLGLRARVVHVFDREGDVYEAIEMIEQRGQSYVIRATANRRLSGGGYLLDSIRNKPEIGRMQVEVPMRDGRLARTAHLSVRAATLRIRPPLELKGRRAQEIDIGIVHVAEINLPKSAEALEWYLLTREPHETIEDCIQVVNYYAKRWKIEEFHMGLKTGCRIEERQLHSRERMETFLGLANVIAIMLVRLRDLARQGGATTVLSPIQTALIRKKFPKLGNNPANRDVLRAVAGLGGFLGRKGDGEPGWRTIWRGMHSLLLMEYGCILGSKKVSAITYG